MIRLEKQDNPSPRFAKLAYEQSKQVKIEQIEPSKYHYAVRHYAVRFETDEVILVKARNYSEAFQFGNHTRHLLFRLGTKSIPKIRSITMGGNNGTTTFMENGFDPDEHDESGFFFHKAMDENYNCTK